MREGRPREASRQIPGLPASVPPWDCRGGAGGVLLAARSERYSSSAGIRSPVESARTIRSKACVMREERVV